MSGEPRVLCPLLEHIRPPAGAGCRTGKDTLFDHSAHSHSRCAARPLTSLVSVFHLSGPLGASHSTPKGCFPWQYLLVCLLVEGWGVHVGGVCAQCPVSAQSGAGKVICLEESGALGFNWSSWSSFCAVLSMCLPVLYPHLPT